MGIRPEILAPATGPGPAVLVGRVDLVEELGSELLVHFELDAERIRAEGARPEESGPLDGGQMEVRGECVARVDPRTDAKVGEQIHLAVDTDRLHFFDLSSGKAIWD